MEPFNLANGEQKVFTLNIQGTFFIQVYGNEVLLEGSLDNETFNALQATSIGDEDAKGSTLAVGIYKVVNPTTYIRLTASGEATGCTQIFN